MVFATLAVGKPSNALTIPLAITAPVILVACLFGIFTIITHRYLTKFFKYVLYGYVAIVSFAILYIIVNLTSSSILQFSCTGITGATTNCIYNALGVVALSPFFYYTPTLVIGFISLVAMCWQIAAYLNTHGSPSWK